MSQVMPCSQTFTDSLGLENSSCPPHLPGYWQRCPGALEHHIQPQKDRCIRLLAISPAETPGLATGGPGVLLLSLLNSALMAKGLRETQSISLHCQHIPCLQGETIVVTAHTCTVSPPAPAPARCPGQDGSPILQVGILRPRRTVILHEPH